MRRQASRWVTSLMMAGTVAAVGACATHTPLTTLRERGDQAFARGDYEVAAQQYGQYVARRPADARARHDLGRALIADGRPGEAIAHLRVAHDLHPDRTEYIESLAEALHAAGRTDELYAFLRGLASDRGGVDDFLRLGQYALKLGDVDEAERALLTAAALDEGRSLEPQLALATLYQSVGDRERAVDRLRMALWVDPANPQVAQRLRDLGEVPGPTMARPPAELPRSAQVPPGQDR